jgi:LDH2 family malate/lactate/ureidoglycolate dehydrogenase
VSEHLTVPEDIAERVPAPLMQTTMASIFTRLGMRDEDARTSAEVLVWADLRGVDSHGVSNMSRFYVEWLRNGFVNPTPSWRVVRQSPATATIDGDRGLGLSVAPQAMALALDKADACGLGSVVVTNSRHLGAAGYHAALALERDMIGVATTLGGLEVVPTFGAEPRVGLNPIAIAAPAGQEPPFLLDASTSSVAANKIRIARRLGAILPGGWIAQPDGTPILEPGPVPDEFLMLPLGATREIGSHKGYGLGVGVDILAGLLGGDRAGFLRSPGDVSHHFLAYRIDAFTDPVAFRAEMDRLLRGLRETPPAPGHERVLYPGLPEHEALQDREARGIPYHPDVIDWFRKTAAELGAECALPHRESGGGL